MTGEEPFGDLFFRLVDKDLFFVSAEINSEDDLKKNLNIKVLECVIREAPETDYERVRQEFFVMNPGF